MKDNEKDNKSNATSNQSKKKKDQKVQSHLVTVGFNIIILMSTSIIRIGVPGKKCKSARVLLDSGSLISFISKATVNRMRIQTNEHKASVILLVLEIKNCRVHTTAVLC